MAFNEQEKKNIVERDAYPTPNPMFPTFQGYSSKSKVTLADADICKSMLSTPDLWLCKPTPYAYEIGLPINKDTDDIENGSYGCCVYWLRTSGESNKFACCVYGDFTCNDHVFYAGDHVEVLGHGIRPVITMYL